MLILTIAVDAPAGQAIGVKEAIAQDLEKYGDVRVISVAEKRRSRRHFLTSGIGGNAA